MSIEASPEELRARARRARRLALIRSREAAMRAAERARALVEAEDITDADEAAIDLVAAVVDRDP